MSVYSWGSLQRGGFDNSVEVVNRRAPAQAAEFRGTIEILLRDTFADSNPESAWTTSLLTSTGAPIEFSFSTLSRDLRYTVEVGGPRTPPCERLARIDALPASLFWRNAVTEVTRSLRCLQGAGTLQWGAWLGLRHPPDGGPAGCKIYAEVPPDNGAAAAGIVNRYLLSPPSLSGESPALTIVAMSPDSERSEFYFDLTARTLTTGGLERLLGHVGLESRRPDLEDLIRSCDLAGPGEPSLPAARYGISYSTLPGAVDPIVSIFARASELLGGDGFVRHQMMAAAGRRGWTLGLYPFITEPIARRFFRARYHNMISFTAGESSVAGLQVCLSPPPLGAGDDE